MSKKFLSFIGIWTLSALFAGCVVVIDNSKPSQDEEQLIGIQGQASQEISQIDQKIQSGNYSPDQIQALATEAKNVMDDNIKKINSLQLPARAQDLADKTKQYLSQAEQTYTAFLQMAANGGQKAADLMNSLKTMTQPLLNMTTQINQLQTEFMGEFKKATS